MYGTTRQKVGRLFADLLKRPQYIYGYLRTNLLRPTPLEVDIPWFSYTAIDFLQSYVHQQMDVFEYGSGGSTIFFAKKARAVVSTEDNVNWLRKVQRRLDDHGITNVTLQHRPFDTNNPVDFEKSAYLRSIPAQQFDIIVVDGTEQYIATEQGQHVRPACFDHAEKFIKPGGIIVVDDSWFYPKLRRTHRGKTFRIFQSVGPCRPGVTSTDIFFY